MTQRKTLRGEAARLVRSLRLQPHPEGGYYRETWRSRGTLRLARGRRPCSTAIIFLLGKGDRSLLHRLKSDETWHFYAGGPLTVAELLPGGRVKRTTLGRGRWEHAVPAGTWFGAYPAPGTGYSLAGCTVAPGFDFRDFEMGDRKTLLARYPRAKRLIGFLTKGKEDK